MSASGFLATLSEIIHLDSNEIFRCLKNICQEAHGARTVLLLKKIISQVLRFGALTFPWNSRLQPTWLRRRIKFAVLIVELLVFYSTIPYIILKIIEGMVNGWVSVQKLCTGCLWRRKQMWRISCRAFCSSHTTHIRFAMLQTCSKFLSKARVVIIWSSQQIKDRYFSLGFLLSSHNYLICLISRIRISPLYGVCCCCF